MNDTAHTATAIETERGDTCAREQFAKALSTAIRRECVSRYAVRARETETSVREHTERRQFVARMLRKARARGWRGAARRIENAATQTGACGEPNPYRVYSSEQIRAEREQAARSRIMAIAAARDARAEHVRDLRARILAELREIERQGLDMSFDFNQGHCDFSGGGVVEIVIDYWSLELDGFDLGRCQFIVGIGIGQNGNLIWNIRLTIGKHPHVADNGDLCYGDASVLISAAVQAGSLTTVVAAVRAVVETYNPDSAYWSIYDDRFGQFCKSCDSHYDFSELTPIGEDYFCDDCLFTCAWCDEARPNSEQIPTRDGVVCELCFRDYFLHCDQCGCGIHEADSTATDGGGLCAECAEKREEGDEEGNE